MFACAHVPLCVLLWNGRVSHSEICADPSALTPRLQRILHLFPPHAPPLLVYMALLEQMHRGSNKDLKQEELNLEGLVYPKNINSVIIYSPSCRSKPILWICGTDQKNTFSIQSQQMDSEAFKPHKGCKSAMKMIGL